MKYTQNIGIKEGKQRFGKLLQMFHVVYYLTFPPFDM